MSDNIPFEIQMEIIQRISNTKSLIQFRSVSKAWKSVIDSKDFVTAHTLRHQAHNHHHLLIRTLDFSDLEVKYYSIVDDDETFPNQKVSVFVPDSVRKIREGYVIILSGSHGLFCFYDKCDTDTAVIWNPSIRKTVAIPVHKNPEYRTDFGFGVCPQNLDPKLVKITYVSDWRKLQDDNASFQVEVFSLSSGGTWRSPLSGNLPHKSIRFGYSQVVLDGFIYWVAVDSVNVHDGFWDPKLIMSFDLTSEQFTKVNLPDPLALNHDYLSLSNLKESLAVLEFIYAWTRICGVWIMIGHGYTRSFNKLYSIGTTDASIITTLGFRKSGVPIIEADEHQEESNSITDSLAIYEPKSSNITNIGIHGITDHVLSCSNANMKSGASINRSLCKTVHGCFLVTLQTCEDEPSSIRL